MSRVVATVMLAIPVAIKLLLCSGDYAKAWSQAVPVMSNAVQLMLSVCL